VYRYSVGFLVLFLARIKKAMKDTVAKKIPRVLSVRNHRPMPVPRG
jgi:hypothetical protein